MQILKTGSQITKTLKNAGRLRTIVGVFARHGFYNIAEKIKLGKFVFERLNTSSEIENLTVAERIRMSFEELGPTFVKLGQLLASRPDLIPSEYIIEFEKLHDKVQPIPFNIVEGVLKEEFGNKLYEKFSSIDPTPIGSASIAQVHQAILASGEAVVVKVQRPGIITTINEDLGVLYMLAELLFQYIPETRIFNPIAVVDEYFKTLTLETNFIVEANNIRKIQENFRAETKIIIPKVYWELTTERVLTLERLTGIPLSHPQALQQPQLDPEELVKICLKVYMKMIFSDGFFHADLHAGNIFIYSEDKIGLIDFGVVGRLNYKSQTAIANMLLNLAKEDYDRLAFEYVDLAPFDERVNIDLFAKDLRNLISPYFGLNLKNVNIGKLLMSSASVAVKHHVALPAELLQFFRSIIHIESVGKKIFSDFDFLNYTLEIAKDILKHQYEPTKITHEVSSIMRESKGFFASLPRELNFFIKKMNHPEHYFKFELKGLNPFRRAIEKSHNLLFLGTIISSLILSSSYIFVHPSQNEVYGFPMMSFVGYIIAVVLSIVAFMNYIRKS